MAKLPDLTALGQAPTPQPQLGVVSDRAGVADDTSSGDALRKVGADLQGVSNELWQFKEKTDTIRVEDAWNQYKNAATDLTAGPTGLLKTQGADAVNGDLLGKSNAALTDARTKIGDSLTDDQRRRFFERADVTDLDTKKQVLGHLAQQQIEYGKTVFQGSEAAAKAQIAAAPTDPGVFRGAQETLMAQADQYLAQNGVKDKATGDALKAKLTDSLWVTRINSLLYSQPALADAMFRANEKEIKDPELRLVMQNKTREVALTVVAGTEAESIMNDTRMELAAPRPAPGQVEVSQKVPGKPGDDMRVTPQVQFKRDQDRLRILEQELKDDPSDVALQREIAGARASVQRQQAGLQRVSDDSLPAPLQENTNGLPNSRDIAAQLPIMMAKVTARADALYGKDQGNPDRAAFIKRLTGELQSRVSQEVQQLNAVQREAQGTLLDAVTGIGAAPGAGGGLMNAGGQPAAPVKITSMAQVMANPTLARAYQMMDVQAKIGVQNLIERNLKADDAGDAGLERQIFNRINLPPGDPNKISFYQQITDPSIANRLSMEQLKRLRVEIDRDATPGGRTFNQMRKAADTDVGLYFKTNVMFTAQPERQIAATMKWNEDAGRKIDEYVAAGKDVRSLFMVDSKDSIVSPAYLQTYVNSTPAQGLAEGAAAVKAGAAPVNIIRAPETIKTPADAEAWIKTLPPTATMFMDSKGQMRTIPGRGQAPASPAADTAMNASGQIVTPQDAAPAVPRLVVPSTPKERALERQRQTQIEKADANVRMVEGVIKGAKAVKGAADTVVGGVANAIEAVNPGEAERSARSFREMIKMGTFTPASESLILDAMDSGMLNPAEERTARAMLRQLASKRK